jgi:Fic family protein
MYVQMGEESDSAYQVVFRSYTGAFVNFYVQAMREFGAPVNAGKIAEITGIDRKEVDKAFAELKKEGAIVSPVRCKWQPA